MDQPVTFSLGDSPSKLRVYVTDIAMDSTKILSEEQSIKTVKRMHKARSDLSRPNCVSMKKDESVDEPDAFTSGDFPAKLRVYFTDVALDSTKIMSEEQSIKTVTSSIQEESAESSSVSIRSDESMDRPDSSASQNASYVAVYEQESEGPEPNQNYPNLHCEDERMSYDLRN